MVFSFVSSLSNMYICMTMTVSKQKTKGNLAIAIFDIGNPSLMDQRWQFGDHLIPRSSTRAKINRHSSELLLIELAKEFIFPPEHRFYG